MYHSVGNNPAFFTVKPEDFEKQMSYLFKNKFNVISASKLAKILEQKEEIPKKTIVITVDDGYENNYLNLFPVLKKYNFPAAIFLITGVIGQNRTTSSGRSFRMLNWEQIREMTASGLVEFCPHSKTHPKFDLIEAAEVEKEVLDSKNVLEDQLKKEQLVFAYPYGRYNTDVIEILKRYGFKAALTVKTGRVKTGDDPLILKRNSIDSKVSLAMFKGIVKYGRI